MASAARDTPLETTVTPMMRQYLSIKEGYPDCLLFYHMGDFYELFHGDAVQASQALDIALTHRGKHLGEDIPMCGVPVHSYESYLNKLIKKGFRVAVCDQMEDPAEAKKRGGKSVVRREVTRIVTPGTLTEDTLLEARSHNYLAALAQGGGEWALSWLDISTGDFFTETLSREDIQGELGRIAPKELLLPDNLLGDKSFAFLAADWRAALTPHVVSFFDAAKGERKLKAFFGVASLASFGEFSRAQLGSCGALLEYVELTQKSAAPRLAPPKIFATARVMRIDAATRRNLELTRSLAGDYRGSLLDTIDRTATSAGARLLYKHLGAPLLDPAAINERLDMAQCFVTEEDLRRSLRDLLRRAPDIERALSRLYVRRGGPRDLAAIRDGLQLALQVADALEFSGATLPKGVTRHMRDLGTHDRITSLLNEALADEVGFYVRDGGFIRPGYDAKLDEYRSARAESENLREELRDRYARETGIDRLKIKDNNVLGYFIEITPQHTAKVPPSFIHRQTMAGAVRYTTQELRELEHKIVNAERYALELEAEIFQRLVEEIIAQAESITLAAQALAGLDVAAALAELAVEQGYARPLIEDSAVFAIEEGRHPSVARALGGQFIPNNCKLSDDVRLWLITGPNMAGKSTFLRQNALIAILAQIGSFVPAASARIGVVDRVFSRVGAADDLARGQSTFMVEMVETATILNQASARSLVILDEIGRGTATFDGLSIAWAVVEHLHDVTLCRCLFATHYHELTALAGCLKHMECHTAKVREWKDDIIFLHEIVPGVADRSYGIHVGKLAGLPLAVVRRAGEVLVRLQQEKGGGASAALETLPLFGLREDGPAAPSAVEEALRGKDLDGLTPREALEFLYALKSMTDVAR